MNTGDQRAGPGRRSQQIQSARAAHVKNLFSGEGRLSGDLRADGADAVVRSSDEDASGPIGRPGRIAKGRRADIGLCPFPVQGAGVRQGRDVMAGVLEQNSDGRSDHACSDNGKLQGEFFFRHINPQKKGLPQREEDPYSDSMH